MTSEQKEELESKYFRSYTDLRKYSGRESEVMFALHSPGGGVTGEVAMRWILLGGKEVPQLQVFDDAWEVMACFHDVMDKLADYDGENITPDKFIEILESFGFINTDSYKGDFIPDEMFESYQLRRKRSKKLDELIS